MDESIFDKIKNASIKKETWDSFERCFGVRGSNSVKHEEFGESHYA